jgi:NAD(P)-dependent dehydrogenase (short-subunit alcohol dehydrogenase family)
MQSVVITGASTGIGESTADYLVRHGFRVFGSVRKPEDGARLKAAIGDAFVPLVFDVTDEAAIRAAAANVSGALHGETLAGLVNNAGISVPGPSLTIPASEWRRQMEVNLIGPLMVAQAFAPLLGTDPSREGVPGRMVNISSVAGKRAFPFQGPYAASKHALEALSEALRRELMLFGVDVIIIGPGPIKTPIWDKGERADFSSFEGTPYLAPVKRMREMMAAVGRNGLPAEDVAALIHHALVAPSPRARYTIAPGMLRRWLESKLPLRLYDRMIAKRVGLTKLPR